MLCARVQQHEKQVREKKRTLKQLKNSIAELMERNSELMKELEGLNVAVNERRHIHEISGRLHDFANTACVTFSLHF